VVLPIVHGVTDIGATIALIIAPFVLAAAATRSRWCSLSRSARAASARR
jgi:hypothetical protein